MEEHLDRERKKWSKNNVFHCNVLTGFYLLTLMINKVLFHFVIVPILFQDPSGNRAHVS